MTTEDYIQWEPLIHKVAFRYRNNRFNIEYDDLIQIASIGVMNAIDSYEEDKGCTYQSYIYTCAQREIFEVFQNQRRLKRQGNVVSINCIIDDDNNTLEELIADEDVNTELYVEDKLMFAEYIREMKLILSLEEFNIVMKKVFTEKTNEEIANELNLSNRDCVRRLEGRAYKKLKYKSKLIREKWFEIIEREEENEILDMYRNPERITIRRDISKKILNKYKREISTLNILQSIFDEMNSFRKTNIGIRKFLTTKLTGILSDTDTYLLEKVVFENIDSSQLIKEGYDYSDIFGIKGKVKKEIIKNKDRVYELWEEID